MTTADSAGTRRQAPRWMWITMVVSLALNLLVAGGIAGAVWHFHNARAMADGAVPGNFAAFVATLPAAKRARIEAMFERLSGEVEPLRAVARAAREEAVGAFTAEPFDKARFAELDQKYRMARRALHDARAKIYPDIIAVLDVGERRQFIRWKHAMKRLRHSFRKRTAPAEEGAAKPARQ